MAEQASEKEKMLAGQLYRASDAILVSDRRLVRQRLKEYNDTWPEEQEKRFALLQSVLGRIGERVEIEPPFRCDYGYNISLGENFYANFNCIILDCAQVSIGNSVFLGPNVQIYTATHPLDPAIRSAGLEAARPITIGNDVWIGGGAILNPGVTIGDGCTIGSGAVVTKDVPPYSLAAGNPCRVIRSLIPN